MGKIINTPYFYGNKISPLGEKYNRVDYDTLAKSFDCVLNNVIMEIDPDGWSIKNGDEYDEDGNLKDIYQTYIISRTGADILEFWTDELVFENEKLGMYTWCVTHYGTPWESVLTDICVDKAATV